MRGLWFWLIGKNKGTYLIRNEKCKSCVMDRKFTCGECGCFKQLKLRVKDERCPLGKW